MKTELPELMTVKQLQEYLNCGHDLAYQLVRRRDFPSFRIGKFFYIKKAELVIWIEKESKKPKY